MKKRKSTKKPRLVTPSWRVKAMLGRLWLWSPERAVVVARAAGKCEECGAVITKKETEVHHIHGSGRAEIIGKIFQTLLVNPEQLKALCRSCHKSKKEDAK